uniref:Putative ovule protein n=1 Tax=Solanum chacoense TaxID=4108 RepID=A0A0V0HJJ3_SOLCH
MFKCRATFTSKGSNLASKKTPRRHLLYTCVASIFAIIHIACRKTEDCNGPIGSIIKKIWIGMSYIIPILYTMQFQWLSILSFIDKCILSSEIVIEKLFPPSSRLFDKIDKLAYVVENLPEKFDDMMEKLPMIIHQVPFLDWALVHLIAWLNFWISCLTRWGSKNAREKEIRIDVNQESTIKDFTLNSDASKDQIMLSNEKSEIEEAISPASSSTCDPFEDTVSSPIYGSPIGIGTSNKDNHFGKCSYKDMLEKRTEEMKEEKGRIV